VKDLASAFENNSDRYHIIVDERGHQIVLDRDKVTRQSGGILAKYMVKSDRSENLEQSQRSAQKAQLEMRDEEGS